MRFGLVFAYHFIAIFVFDRITASALQMPFATLRPGHLLGAGSPANRAAIQFS